MELIYLVYIIVVNGIAFIMMGIDKHRAEKRKWRVPEKKLWLLAIMGGSIGSMIGMKIFRHKTKHPAFQFGMPVILTIQVLLYILLKI
ncbi:DUF1294 domain-containing protein [Paraliobacillus sp. JSM ZJ581]|uniref:DUF1294 domain-containing protein n=1 Tax=Paraliobacillus sp. JSM ZJ581 TaxID=3342118 RepID=UPI0035A97CF4